MVCPECGSDNKPGARLCELCGHPMPVPAGPVADGAAEERIAARRRQDRIAAPILAAVIVALISLLVWRFLSIPRYVEASREQVVADYPVATVDAYYKALEAGDFAAAYKYLAPEIQQRMPEATFTQLYTSGQAPTPTGHKVKDTGEFGEARMYMAVSVSGRPTYCTLSKGSDGWRVEWTPALGQALQIPPPLE